MSDPTSPPASAYFQACLKAVNQGVTAYSDTLRSDIAGHNPDVQFAVECYLSLLERGGKRLRGVLGAIGYDLYRSSTNHAQPVPAFGAIEALHAYLLLMDDVADNADLRRGAPAAHIAMANHLHHQAGTEAAKLGADTTQMAALYAQHQAQLAILSLTTPTPEAKLLALSVLNDGLARTCLGQIQDMLSTTSADVSEADILKIATYKTAYYSFLLPLQIGAALAGAPTAELTRFDNYSLHAGLAFQMQDDILGLFGDEASVGKSVKSDLREGKKTLLITWALNAATTRDRHQLEAAMGNPKLSDVEFETCRNIVARTGSREKVEALAAKHLALALAALDATPATWPAAPVNALRDITNFLSNRRAN